MIGLILAGTALAIVGAILGAMLAPVLLAFLLAFVVALSALLLMEAALGTFPGFFGNDPGIGTFLVYLLIALLILVVALLIIATLVMLEIATAGLAWAVAGAALAVLVDLGIMGAFWYNNTQAPSTSAG